MERGAQGPQDQDYGFHCWTNQHVKQRPKIRYDRAWIFWMYFFTYSQLEARNNAGESESRSLSGGSVWEFVCETSLRRQITTLTTLTQAMEVTWYPQTDTVGRIRWRNLTLLSKPSSSQSTMLFMLSMIPSLGNWGSERIKEFKAFSWVLIHLQLMILIIHVSTCARQGIRLK